MSSPDSALAGTGVTPRGEVHANLAAPALVTEALRRGEGRLSAEGAFIAVTGAHTGRSVQDKFVVDEPATRDAVWWGKVNQPMPAEKFSALVAKVRAYLSQKPELFTQDLHAGADPAHRIGVRLVTTSAWHALFARNMFIRPAREALAGFGPDWTILHAPEFEADPAVDGCRSTTVIALSLATRTILIAGTSYAGEIKKSIFTVMNWLLPERGVLPMHCSANVGAKGDVALFFGLSGTGKTTLSSDPERALIGDDEHGWSDAGVFNFEGGCYAKVIRLSREAEPQIWDASHRFGAVLENVVADQDGKLDLDDGSLTENTRSCYPIDFIPNTVAVGRAGLPKNVRLHRARRGHREGPGQGAAGDLLHLLRRALPAAAPRGLRQDAVGPDLAPRRGLLAGQYRLVGRGLWHRQPHVDPGDAGAAARGTRRVAGAGGIRRRSLLRADDAQGRAGHRPRRAQSAGDLGGQGGL